MNKLLSKKKDELNQKKKKGFTLVELIIVIAIIAILAAVAIPKFGSMRKDAKVSNDVAAAKNIATVTSTLIANGTIQPNTYDLSKDGTVENEIKEKLDGKAKNGLGEATGKPFVVTVGSNDAITVTCNGARLYPDAQVSDYNSGTTTPESK